jgi:HD superfamily phosphohydrolase
VAHLAFKFANQLWQAQRAELDCDRGDIRVVELAGLCHDLGHGPFSHVFEREFLKRRGITGWEHEAMSARMLDHIVDDNAIDTISPQDIKRVKGLITAGHAPEHGGQGGGQDGGGANGHAAAPPQGAASLAPWLSEVVANGRNGVDVDKADYLQRDSLYCGVRLSCDFNRIMQFSRVIGGEICSKYSEYMGLHELFHARASMHRAVYTHKKAKAVEFMVVDALVEADKALRFTDRIWDPAQFSRLDDSILETVENLEALGRVVHVEDEDAAPLAAAQAIIARLRRRQLYKYVTDAPVPGEALERGRWAAPSAQDIVACHHGDGGLALRAEDIILQENKIDFSMRNRNPLDSVSFYDDLESAGKRSLRADQISSMVVASFEDMRLRCYSRNADPRYVAAVHRAFESWVHRRFGGQVATSTPAKPAREAAEAAPTLAAMETAAAGPAAAGAKRGRELTFEGQAEAAGARRARQ